MKEPTCTTGYHVGIDVEGRCSVCNERWGRTDLRRVGLTLVVISAVITLVLVALLLWLLVA